MDYDIELRHLRYCAALAEELSFTKAARRLRIAQPSLSLQIRQLEDRLGATLFIRKPRLDLTAAGNHFVIAARQVLRHALFTFDAAHRIGRSKQVVLHVAIASSASLTAVSTVLKRFVDAHPEVDLNISELHSADQVRALRNGMIDVGISRETPDESGFVVRELLRERFLLVLPAAHPLASARRPRLDRCATERFVLFPRAAAPMLRDQIEAMCRESGFVPKVEVEAREWHTTVALVAAGLGISIAPASVAALNIHGAVMRAIPSSTYRAALFLCHTTEQRQAPIRALADFIVAAMSRRNRVSSIQTHRRRC